MTSRGEQALECFRSDQSCGEKVFDLSLTSSDLSLDHLDPVRTTTNASSTLVSRKKYYPFGEEATPFFEQAAIALKYTGHERDAYDPTATGDDRDYMHARYRSPITGRFMSVDPAGDSSVGASPQGWNRFSYARDNPLWFVDPDGRATQNPTSIFMVRVNVLYSQADYRPGTSNPSLRQTTEIGISRARSFFSKAGIALRVRRFDATILESGRVLSGVVQTNTRPVDIRSFAAETNQINVIVGGNAIRDGQTKGIGGPTRIGVLSDAATLTDELAHVFGNVTSSSNPISNTWTDIYTDLNEALVGFGIDLIPAYEDMLRATASEIRCELGSHDCETEPEPSPK